MVMVTLQHCLENFPPSHKVEFKDLLQMAFEVMEEISTPSQHVSLQLLKKQISMDLLMMKLV